MICAILCSDNMHSHSLCPHYKKYHPTLSVLYFCVLSFPVLLIISSESAAPCINIDTLQTGQSSIVLTDICLGRNFTFSLICSCILFQKVINDHSCQIYTSVHRQTSKQAGRHTDRHTEKMFLKSIKIDLKLFTGKSDSE